MQGIEQVIYASKADVTNTNSNSRTRIHLSRRHRHCIANSTDVRLVKSLSVTIACYDTLNQLFHNQATSKIAAMAAKLDSQLLGLVFQSRPDILKGIQEAAGVFLFLTTNSNL